MPMIDPSNYNPNAGGGSRRDALPGDYTALAIGHDYRNPSGKSLVEIRFVVLRDHTHGGDMVGATFDLTFWLTDRALWRMENFAWATTYAQAFDPMISDHLERVMLAGPVRVAIKAEERNGYKRMDTAGRFNRASGFQTDPTTGGVALSNDDERIADAAADGWAKLMAARTKGRNGNGNRRRDGGNGNGYGGNGGGNGYGNDGGGGYNNDDIPF